MFYFIHIFLILSLFYSCKDPQSKNTNDNSSKGSKNEIKSKSEDEKKQDEDNDTSDNDDDDDDDLDSGVPNFRSKSLGKCFNKECQKNIIEDPNDANKIYKMKVIKYYTPLYLDYRKETEQWKKDITKYSGTIFAAPSEKQIKLLRKECFACFPDDDDASDDSSEFSVWQPITSSAANADEVINNESYKVIGPFAKKFRADEKTWTPSEPTGVIALRAQLDEETSYTALQPPLDYHTIWYNIGLDAGMAQQSCSGSDAAKWPQTLYCKNLGGGAVKTSEQGGAPEVYREALSKSITIWRPVASNNYKCIADVITSGEDKPQYAIGASGQMTLGMNYGAYMEMAESLKTGLFDNTFDQPTYCFPKENLVKGTLDSIIATATDASVSNKIVSLFKVRARKSGEPNFDENNMGVTIPGLFIALRGSPSEVIDEANKIVRDDPNNPPKRHVWVLKKELVKIMEEEGVDPNIIDMNNHWGKE